MEALAVIRPVIVGIGEFRDKPDHPSSGLDPLGIMAAAALLAEKDAGLDLIHKIDAIELIHQISWRYEDTAQCFCERLGVHPPRAVYHPGGGESPIRIIHDSAIRIAQGQARIVLICGGEARSTVQKALRQGIDLPWRRPAEEMEHPWRVNEIVSPMGRAHGIAQASFVYPLYENACVEAWGQTPAEGRVESARLWARFAATARANPYSWIERDVAVEEIISPTSENPFIAWPYTRLMVANPTVNLGAAVIMMGEDTALDLGISPSRMIHICGGAAAMEPEDYLHRDCYYRSTAQEAVLDRAMALHPDSSFDAIELYSCFPCVPKMALRHMQIADDAPTVTGGLTFFGGPFNSYMLHATCAMVRRLRLYDLTGLLYGQGDFVTKHHALVLSSHRPLHDLSVDYRCDARGAWTGVSLSQGQRARRGRWPGCQGAIGRQLPSLLTWADHQ